MIMNRKLFLLVIGMLLVTSCTKEPDDIAPEDKTPAIVRLTDAEAERLPLLSDNPRRSPETVLAFAQNYAKTVLPESKAIGNLSISDSVLLSDIPTKGSSLKAAPIYVVSRGEGQGFVLVAGDNRIAPVWGIIEKGDYAEGINPGFDIVMEQLKNDIMYEVERKECLRDSVYDALRIKLGLDKTPDTKGDDDLIPDPPGPPDVFYPEDFDRIEIVERNPHYENEYQYGPLLKTKWNQRSPFNDFRTDNAPAGCMAISCGQIMAYHKHPSYLPSTGHYYTWDEYRPYGYQFSSGASANVSVLMQDLGLKPYLHLVYDIEGTGADCSHTPRTLEAFGYTINGAHRTANFNDIYNEIKEYRPVHICGDDNGFWVKKGHTWVTDGVLHQNCFVTYYMQFYKNDYLICEVERGTGQRSSSSFVHHNFGWGGQSDGWMGMKPTTNHVSNANGYNNNMKIIIGIRPR